MSALRAMAPGQDQLREDQPSVDPGDPLQDLEWFELVRAAPPEAFELSAGFADELALLVAERIKPGARVGVAVGSRGIARLPEVVASLVEALRAGGAAPVLIPAMGSHGGATPAGQVEVLHELGVDEVELGVPVDASMEVEEVGRLPGDIPVYLAGAALGCDAIVPVNRVKPHSDFRAPVESGLTKMLAIGLGKQRGASTLHSSGFESFVDVLPATARLMLEALHVPFGIAVVEDAWHRVRRVEAVPGEQILERDASLLEEAWAHFGALPFEHLDVLLLREMGKTISGAGMDPNVTGRFSSAVLPARTAVDRLVVLDLVEASGGNANGVGLADFVVERLRAKIDWEPTYANAMAARAPACAKLPLVAGDDREAISLAVASLTGTGGAPLRVVAMANTLEVNHIVVSRPLVEVARKAGYSQVGDVWRAEFDPRGVLLRIAGLDFFPDHNR